MSLKFLTTLIYILLASNLHAQLPTSPQEKSAPQPQTAIEFSITRSNNLGRDNVLRGGIGVLMPFEAVLPVGFSLGFSRRPKAQNGWLATLSYRENFYDLGIGLPEPGMSNFMYALYGDFAYMRRLSNHPRLNADLLIGGQLRVGEESYFAVVDWHGVTDNALLLEPGILLGARASYKLANRWALFADGQFTGYPWTYSKTKDLYFGGTWKPSKATLALKIGASLRLGKAE